MITIATFTFVVLILTSVVLAVRVAILDDRLRRAKEAETRALDYASLTEVQCKRACDYVDRRRAREVAEVIQIAVERGVPREVFSGDGPRKPSSKGPDYLV